ncbi:AbrB/MazE/SpoVT family DNA-binding domain-containing protein [Roseateles violae]|uniref:AbrB/MazE/SpoVT family DNA-binding domain-containing protein n=1 Tax=Roseateles violae TaxID=3058042 RepID=A0ABT8DMP4_9BURK|nr:AbrB/MazE/SpoVT family DNA-binding domain-containing protein [Pelomonas sp. PFR6]MDN3919208.1 AbrB/MazE/SpoVT family DNA-binding domain-containing protein [Pelomonas sp. PFR6]
MLAKLTSKNQLTLPKSVTEALGPVQYFEVQARAGQIILTPVRIQRGDAVRAKLAELAIDEKTLAQALSWAQPVAKKKPAVKKPAVKKPLAAKTAVARKKPAATKKAAAR